MALSDPEFSQDSHYSSLGEQVTFRSTGGTYTLRLNHDVTVRAFLDFLTQQCSAAPESLREMAVVVEDVRSGEDPETMRTRTDILEYMRRFNLTQAMLCRPVGVSQSVLSQWMRSRYNGANGLVTDKVRGFLHRFPDGIPTEQLSHFQQQAVSSKATGKRARQ